MGPNNQTCRLCLSNTNKNCVVIFQKVSSKYSLVNLVNIYFGIEISESDQFSTLVCKPCVIKITDFHTYVLSVKRNNEYLLETIKTEHVDIKSGITEIGLTSNRNKPIDAKSNENELLSIEQVYIKEDLPENEPSCSTLDDIEDDNLSNDVEESENTSGSLPVVEPQVILEESDGSTDTEPVKARNSSKKREKTRKLANYPETPNDVQIKKFYKYECDLCKDHSEITSFRAFKIHYKNKHGIAAYIKCCGRKFKRPYALVGHIEEHLMPDSLKCPNCSKKLRTKQTLLLHMDTHVPVEQRPLKCKYCEMRFVRKHFLIQHEKIHLSDDELKYICDLCGKRFPTDWRLRTHLNSTHSDEKPFVCDVCAKSFKLKVQLQNHMYIHNNKEGHKQCEQCGVWLKSPRTYYVHMKEKHDDSAPKSFPCTKCTHVSPTRKALYAHSINKHGPKKHNCIYCGDAFSSSNLLKSHMIKHTGPGEPLKCPFCPKSFSFRSGYYSHKKKVHPNMTEIKYNN